MKKISLIFIIFIIGIYCTPCNAEYTSKQYTQIPPSPEVASLMKYIDVPVSHFTGQPQIVYEIECPTGNLSEGIYIVNAVIGPNTSRNAS